ncbi:S8/S53 family peptidase [Bacteriovoracaceae bacterium]|nr:S8/S53 family peptidase [Bacteriovoracaceae bacterium]
MKVLIFLLVLSVTSFTYSKALTLNKFLFSTKYEYIEKSKLCPGGVTPDWAKKVIAADLAEAYIKNKLQSVDFPLYEFPNVTVIDSGFDVYNQQNNMHAVSFNSKAASRKTGKHYRDHDGHGTAVSGVIAAKDIGITHFLNLTSVRVTPPHAGGSVKNKHLNQAIKKACETSDIVNVSWGGLMDELGFLDPSRSSWYKTALAKGCLVFKSAGNSGYIHEYKKINLSNSNPLMTVGSTNHQNQVSLFSTSGMIYAPGEDVFTLLSHQHKYSKETYRKQCQNFSIPFAPISGTSFSSPISSGVAAQVLTILKLNEQVPSDPEQKISLIKRIMKASTLLNAEGHFSFRRINALAAVYIADQINSDNMNFSEEKLGNLISRHSLVSCEPFSCDEGDESNEQLNYCGQKYRHQIYTCSSDKIPKSSYLSLLSIQQKLGENKQNIFLSTLIPNELRKEDKFNQKVLQDLEANWQSNLKIENSKVVNEVKDFEEAIKLISLALKFDQQAFFTAKKLRELLNGAKYTFLNANNLFSDSTIHSKGRKIFSTVRDFYLKLSEDKVIEFLGTISTEKKGKYVYSHAINELEASLLIYLMKQKKDLSPIVRSTLEKKLKKMLSNFKQNKLLHSKYQYSFIRSNHKFFEELFDYYNISCLKEFKTIFGYEDLSIQFYCQYSEELSGAQKYNNSKKLYESRPDLYSELQKSIRIYLSSVYNKKPEKVENKDVDNVFKRIKKELDLTFMFNLFKHPDISDEEKAAVLKRRLVDQPSLELPYNLFSIAKTRSLLLKDQKFVGDYLDSLSSHIQSKITDQNIYYSYDLHYFNNNLEKLIFDSFTLNRSIFNFEKTLEVNSIHLKSLAERLVLLYKLESQTSFLKAQVDKFQKLNIGFVKERDRKNLRYGKPGYRESIDAQKKVYAKMILYRNKINSIDSFKGVFLKTISFFFNRKEEFEKVGQLEHYQKLFEPIRNDLLSKPGNFDHAMTLSISRFYNLDEV